MTYEWKVDTVPEWRLEDALNEHEAQSWDIFSVVPTLKFENTEVVMATLGKAGVTVLLPKKVEYNILMRKRKLS